ncbi:TPA: transposase, partial [Candidatus Avacholeplasma faecigallinarum]|nr:transposase [Candidatus Avacholeplasma faecigallinarum]
MTNTFTAVAKKYQVSTTYVINLFDKKVELKRLNLPEVLSIDEVYGRKLTYKGYCFVLYAPQWKKIVDVLDSRKKLDLIDYFARISLEEKSKVKYVSMDLYETYRIVIKKCLPNAIICADPFHVVKQLVTCFESIRKRVMRRYEELKNQGHNYYWLYKKYKWMLLKDLSKIKDVHYVVSKSGMIMNKYQ